VEKYDIPRQATHDNIIRRMRIACWIIKATDTHSQCGIIVALPQRQGCKNAPHYYVIRFVPCLDMWC